MNAAIPPSTVSAHAAKLGLFLVAEHLVVVCRHVCSVLSARGRMTLDELCEALGSGGGLSDVHHRHNVHQHGAAVQAAKAQQQNQHNQQQEHNQQQQQQQPTIASRYFRAEKKSSELHARSALYTQAASGIDAALDTKLDRAEISKALVVLNHHGLLTMVRVVPHGRSRTRKKYTTYTLNLRNMLLRLRFPQFILATEKLLFGTNAPTIFNDLEPERADEEDADDDEVGNDVGGDGGDRDDCDDPDDPDDSDGDEGKDETMVLHCRALMKTILTSSQVTKDIVFKKALREFKVELEEAGIDIVEGSERDREEEQTMRDVFDILCEASIVIPCRGAAIREEDSSKSQKSKKKVRDSSSSSSSYGGGVHAPPESPQAASKRRRTTTGFVASLQAGVAEMTWYTTNFSLLHRLLRDNHMRDFVSSRFEGSSENADGIGYAFGCMLRAAREARGGAGKHSCTSVRSVSFRAVADASRPIFDGVASKGAVLSENEARKAARELQQCRSLNVVQVSGSGNAFSLFPQCLVAFMQRKIAEEFVFERYGEKSTRIFRLLLDKGQLDQKLVSELALIPMKHVRAMLYRMMQDGVIKLQEIAKRADRTPQNTYFMWSVHLPSTYYAIVEFVHRSLYNLTLRKQRGTNDNEDVVKRCEIAGGGFTRLADIDPHLIKTGMQSCRDSADVGKVVSVNIEEETFTVQWPQAGEEIVPFDDPDIGVADETQLTEEDQTRYHALLLATDRIDHTVQRLDEVLTVLMEFHTHHENRLATEDDELVLDGSDEELVE